MPTLLVIAAVSVTINIIMGILTFLLFLSNIQMRTQIQQIHSAMSTTLNKLLFMEQMLSKLGHSFAEFIKITDNVMFPSHNQMLFKTSDGKYAAKSLDELIDKIKNDGSQEEYFNEDEIDKLKKMFETDDDDEQDEE